MTFRLATPADLPFLRQMIIDSFEPITWFKHLDSRFGPLNGCDWRRRWELRLDKIFASQILLVGEVDHQVVAAATGTYDAEPALGYIDLLAVHQPHQGKGYGREMLRGMVDHLKSMGARYCNLECLADNDTGNALYRAEGWQLVAQSNRWFIELDSDQPRP